jgi:hypothetical protein
MDANGIPQATQRFGLKEARKFLNDAEEVVELLELQQAFAPVR